MRSIVTDDLEHCLICGSPYVSIHHLMFGRGNRAVSDDDGLIVPLCAVHHNMATHDSVHLNPVIERWSKIAGQLAWELENVSNGQIERNEAETQFLNKYGKKYL